MIRANESALDTENEIVGTAKEYYKEIMRC